jgi:glycosyltransferase involved in cell wall biosynthesis
MNSKGSILFVSKRRDAASTRYRIFQYWDYLRAAGWELDYHPAGGSRIELLRKAARADIVVIQRKLFDALTLTLLKRANPNLVFDYDDAIFLNDDGSPSARRLRRFKRSIRHARLCLAGNQYLSSHSLGQHTLVFPTTVEMTRYREVANAPPPVFTLVWIGSRSTSRYLEAFRDTLESLGQAMANIQLKVIGDFEIQFEHLTTHCIPWSADGEVAELASAHAGIAPMLDDPWTRGKCALKVIQYMACGLPVISSDCGANAEVIRDGETGYLVSDTEEWIAAARTLQDEERRRTMGQAARGRADAHYSAEALARVMDNWFTALLQEG